MSLGGATTSSAEQFAPQSANAGIYFSPQTSWPTASVSPGAIYDPTVQAAVDVLNRPMQKPQGDMMPVGPRGNGLINNFGGGNSGYTPEYLDFRASDADKQAQGLLAASIGQMKDGKSTPYLQSLTPSQIAFFDFLDAPENKDLKDMRGALLGDVIGGAIPGLLGGPVVGVLGSGIMRGAGLIGQGTVGDLLRTDKFIEQMRTNPFYSRENLDRLNFDISTPISEATAQSVAQAYQNQIAAAQAANAANTYTSPSYDSAYNSVISGGQGLYNYGGGTLSDSSYRPAYTGSSEGE